MDQMRYGNVGDRRERHLARAAAAGQRWQGLLARRQETIERLHQGGPEFADTPKRVQKFLARESAKRLAFARAGVTERFFAERQIGKTLDLDDYPPNDAARVAGSPVGRIVLLDDRGGIRDGFATGFLIAANVLLTNEHVFASAAEVTDCGVQFGYEMVNDALSAGAVFRLNASKLFYANAELDFAIVAVESVSVDGAVPLQRFRTLPLIPVTGKILVGHAISIIQHPEGRHKRFGVRDNELLVPPIDEELFIHYTTDTLPGSSGSPAFNKDWEVVALHHSGVPEMRDGHVMTVDNQRWTRDMPDSRIKWVANEGARISCICTHLATVQVSPEQRPLLQTVLETFGDDFAGLPALQSQEAGAGSGLTAVNGAIAGMNITVNGTANFYVGTGPGSAPQPGPKPIELPRGAGVPVAVEKKLLFDPRYSQRPGFSTQFLRKSVPLPRISQSRLDEILKKDGQPRILKYHHYSLVMNETRKLVMWAAANVDYTKSKRRKTREEFGTDTWIPDPRIPGEDQIQDAELYEPAKKFDRGHIIRRDDVAWGDTAEIEVFANSDSFHWTNCTPQHEQFNRDMFEFDGLWGGLENHIAKQAKNVGNRLSVFAGPILNNDGDIRHDFGPGEVLVPRKFWKIVFVVEDAETNNATLKAFGFILDQTEAIDEFGIEKFSQGRFKVFQESLETISAETGVEFDDLLLRADTSGLIPDESRRRPLQSLEQVRV